MALTPHMNVMLRTAEKAGRTLVRDFGEVEQLQVSRKSPGDFVSAADLRAEETIHYELSKARPDYGFLMEEGGTKDSDENAAYRWIVDPLDGTANFLHGYPQWCVSIALEHNKDGKRDIIAAVVYDPLRDEAFRAEKGQGAFVRNKRLLVSSRSDFETVMVLAPSPRHNEAMNKDIQPEYEAVEDKIRGLRMMGSAALSLAYVAAGRVDAYWERFLHPWDAAAGYLLVKEAGGRVTPINNNKDNPVYDKNILASNMALYDSLRPLLTNANKKQDAA